MNLNSKDILPNVFLNDSYRKLINNGRTYASYTNDELNRIFNDLKDIDSIILDPMSGYGGLMNYCKAKNHSTYNLEINLPAYFWQILVNPQNQNIFSEVIDEILASLNEFPKIKINAEASDDWFTSAGISLSIQLLNYINDIFSRKGYSNKEYAIALILPFIKRFSTCISGDLTHLKKGGITVFNGWIDDFESYLVILKNKRLQKTIGTSNHYLELGDIRNHNFQQKFKLLITSPPYPNYRDYHKMFAPENYFLEKINYKTNQDLIIGSNVVRNRKSGIIASKVALNFLHSLENFKGTPKAEKDIKSYYTPYFRNYFYDLELTCNNIIEYLDIHATCYFVIVNNATRNFIIPVKQVIQEIFVHHGFNFVSIYDEEVFHVGTKNPHARGLKAKHNKFIIKLWK